MFVDVLSHPSYYTQKEENGIWTYSSFETEYYTKNVPKDFVNSE